MEELSDPPRSEVRMAVVEHSGDVEVYYRVTHRDNDDDLVDLFYVG
jgi:hypothetical protein